MALQRLPCATFSRYLRVFLAADAIRNPCLTQIRQSFIVNEFPVSIEGFDMDFGKGLTEKLQQNHSFACVGIPLFIQRFPQYRDSDTTPDDGQHQDVDTGFAVFPCRAVEGEADVLPAENRECVLCKNTAKRAG